MKRTYLIKAQRREECMMGDSYTKSEIVTAKRGRKVTLSQHEIDKILIDAALNKFQRQYDFNCQDILSAIEVDNDN